MATLTPVYQAYSETFASASTWTVVHNLQVDAPAIDVYNGSNERIMPAAVVVVDDNTLRIDWSTATAGRVYVV